MDAQATKFVKQVRYPTGHTRRSLGIDGAGKENLPRATTI